MGNTIKMFVIAARDGNLAKNFYEGVFNWKVTDVGPLLQISGAGLSGHILKWPHNNHPTHTSMYINVENIQECLAKVEEMGGTVILPEMAVPTGGSIAQFVDPDGIIMGAYQGTTHAVSQSKAVIDFNQIGFFEIAAREGHRSLGFYEAVFNWRITDDGPVMSISDEDTGLDGHLFNWTFEEQPYLTLYIRVADMSACLEKVTELGGKVILPETEIPSGGTFAQFLDLDGNPIGIYSGR
ncbi:glyoxalase/bleomycin resistance protein/dioxygenase [Neobacillus bataviensis LMG 21833]|uniref:Glyoxalase/bleomycin resistance protein/dioxygenase n=1 Tax=Neobacillus bataviensis LMG 21833 TaxID=1117379 RepID=K6DCZ5_9BACI|nr:VOC family protein [Neobacillus bataviensis]EKN66184.1 glyoxalase/bleomycin resistance protein/dioxygenase [Neobacillus bataviensis LMG 21833]